MAQGDLDLLAAHSREGSPARQDGGYHAGGMSLNPALLLEWGYWTNGTPGPASPISYGLLALFVLLTAASAFVWLRRRKLFPGQRIKTRLAAQHGPSFVGIAAVGIVLLLLRVVEFPILSMRLFWVLDLIVFVALAAYIAWYLLRRYPVEVARLAREEERQRWVPKPRQRRGGRRR
jgi:hypothetical protein